MSNVDGITKIPKDELKQKREIILDMINERRETNKGPRAEKVEVYLFDKKKSSGPIEKKNEEKIQEKTPSPIIEKETVETSKKTVMKETKEDNPKKTKATTKKEDVEKKTHEKKKALSSDKKELKQKIKAHKLNALYKYKFHLPVLAKKTKSTLEKIVFTLVMSFFITTIIYFSLFLLIITFKIDNSFFRFAEKYLPVPAMVINGKIIGFYDYVDLLDKSAGKKDADIKYELVRGVITSNFFKKYKTNDIAMLNKLIVNDNEVNNVSLNRIKKIKQLIDDGGDFDEIIGKYGEDRGSITLKNADLVNYEYGEKVKLLGSGQTSDIIYTNNGYYIFKCHDKNSEEANLSFVFVRAKSFDKYLEEITKNVYFVSFVE